jgi:hypothetical protein
MDDDEDGTMTLVLPPSALDEPQQLVLCAGSMRAECSRIINIALVDVRRHINHLRMMLPRCRG